ncbi:TPA: transposase, partial [Vibrio cholerae]|nr:transposase [Vibrio cholerae]
GAIQHLAIDATGLKVYGEGEWKVKKHGTDGKRRVWRKLHLAVGCQKLYGSNNKWKKRYGYHKRSLSETAMYRVKQLLGGRLSLRNYNAQVGEAYPMIKALNKITGLGMPKTCPIG